jgi:hypothetical protein
MPRGLEDKWEAQAAWMGLSGGRHIGELPG